ncbi:MAG: ATP-binding cassette domain-containing protein [Undibacterium sp.]|nr:ATP-binding cassette domain-containing protein [Undibacterium sp.]
MTNNAQISKTLLQVSGLCLAYPQRELFKDLSIDIPPGVSLIRGEGGCGKTSLLRLFAGELAADSGQLQLNQISAAQQPQAYRRQVFWIDPRTDAFDQISPLAYFDTVRQASPDFDDALLAQMIPGLALTAHLEKALYMQSTGSKRKVWLAAAFASGATLTLLDEPFAALDQASVRFVMQLLTQAAGQGKRAWVVSHYDSLDPIALAALIDLPS